jgi:hypothetical protein
MAIAKKPKSNTTASSAQTDDPRAVAFITGADKPAAPTKPPEPEPSKTPVMVRFDSSLLRRIDEAAKHRCISRSAWIQSTLSRALDSGEG